MSPEGAGYASFHIGQSFLTPDDGTNDTLTGVRFAYAYGGSAPWSGNLYLFGSEFTGLPGNLNAASPLAVGAWDGGSQLFAFDSGNTTLTPDTTYWIYTDTPLDFVAYSTNNPYAGGEMRFTYSPLSSGFGSINPDLDAGFTVYATAGGASAVPEPSTYAAMAGVAMLGFAVIRRRRSRRV